jgi:hypothetical protein
MGPKRRAQRTLRRERGRLHEKLVRDLEALARLEPGGAPDRPLLVDSPVVVDLRAVAKPCPLCEGPLRLEEHAATEIDGARLRVATVACTQCGARRSLYFRLDESLLH